MIFKWLFLCRLEIFPLFIYIMYDAELHDIQFFDNFLFCEFECFEHLEF